MLNQKPSAIDDLVEAKIKCGLAGRRLEVFGADPGTRERLLLSWRPRYRGDGAGGGMFLCFQNLARLAKSDRPTAPGPPIPLFLQHRKRDSQIPGVLPWLDTCLL